ncbi:hypothetical protein LTR35_014724 [Friedmanniomyces endolithicus]|uniref:Uncharacterized protein n=1 Tax=Friedmanniomyces endolithicus TaxID=329885 RepID=A0AAN6FAW9_9PEZI|nr:hypothetical protein LTR35_014724 [Friedmanniomyces endolithicus]KAK0271862.1 hypothetical protein LTS00_016476 [Friedmanniomyces endolithicus]KAK0312322.1 hypothetical protein LTR82_013954 [Friedmanniomyces endolithicus]
MPEPKAYIELAGKPLNPELKALNGRRLRSVARWHAFAMREEARVWSEGAEKARQRPVEQQEARAVQGDERTNTKVFGDMREKEQNTKQAATEDSQQELTSNVDTSNIEKHDHDRVNRDEECHHGTAESDSSAINDGESPEKKQAVAERVDEHRGHIHTPEFNRVSAQKAEMPMLNHSAATGSA